MTKMFSHPFDFRPLAAPEVRFTTCEALPSKSRSPGWGECSFATAGRRKLQLKMNLSDQDQQSSKTFVKLPKFWFQLFWKLWQLHWNKLVSELLAIGLISDQDLCSLNDDSYAKILILSDNKQNCFTFFRRSCLQSPTKFFRERMILKSSWILTVRRSLLPFAENKNESIIMMNSYQ